MLCRTTYQKSQNKYNEQKQSAVLILMHKNNKQKPEKKLHI